MELRFEAYGGALKFFSEFRLSSEPLRIDCVVVKKAKDLVIKENIAAMFRTHNLIEYKSPDDYVSVEDFYKVYGYACLYASFEKVPITSLTISFVERRYPRKLLVHLEKERGYSVAETSPGIYTVSDDLDPLEVKRISAEIARQGKAAHLSAYLRVIAQANPNAIQEAIEMADTLTIEQVFENVGWTAKWEARGEARGKAESREEIARNLKNMGLSTTQIAEGTGLPLETIQKL